MTPPRFFADPSLEPWLYRNDPVLFASECLGFQPDRNQAQMLQIETHRAILACHRQWGKTTTAAVKAIHHACYHPDSLSIIVAPTLRQSGLLLQAISRFARHLSLDLGTDSFNRPSLVFPNGARIVAVPADEDNIRGFSAVSLLLIDEAARVSDEVWAAVLPMVSTVDGSVWLMSTPDGRLGFFADLWFSSEPEWSRICVKATDASRIPASVLEQQRRALTRAQFAQDYLCEFGETANQVFPQADIDAAFSSAFKPLPAHGDKGAGTRLASSWDLSYFLGLDLGQSQDYSVLTVLELHSWYDGWRHASSFVPQSEHTLRVRDIRRFPSGTTYPEVMNRTLALIGELGQRTTLVVDATGLGAPFVDFIKGSNFRLRSDYPSRPPQLVRGDSENLAPHGYLLPIIITAGGNARAGERGTWNVPKVDLIETLQRMFQNRRLEISSGIPEAPTLRSELLALRRDGNIFEPCSARIHDDAVMSLALAAWRVSRQRPDLLWPAEEPSARRPA